MPYNRLEWLREAHQITAELVLLDPVYIPIFERIERDLLAEENQDDMILRARAALERYKASA
jgi:hypothetical protein